MTELLERAVEAARRLSPEMQDEIAHMLLQIAGDGEQPVACLSPEEAASFDESFAQAARGAFASDERVRAIWANISCATPRPRGEAPARSEASA